VLAVWRADGRVALAAGLVLFSVANAPAISLLDAAALGHLKRAGGSFGRIRLWGSVGFIAASFGFGTVFPGLPLAAIGASLAAAYAAFAAFVSVARIEEAPPATGGWSGLWSVVRSRAVILLLVTVFLNRVASAPFNNFYTIFVRDSGHGGDVVAATWGIAVTTEVALMLAVDRLIGRFGFGPVLACGVLLEAARWFAYAMVSSKVALLLLAPLHGIAFALLYVAGVHGLAALTPARWRSLGQGLGAAAGGLGQVVGSVAAGYAHQALGARAMFAAAGVAGVAALGFALLAGREGGRA
jgi:PPP family 3-phenylpropionic acid transporter